MKTDILNDLSKISTNINNYVQGNKVHCFRQKRALRIHNVHIHIYYKYKC